MRGRCVPNEGGFVCIPTTRLPCGPLSEMPVSRPVASSKGLATLSYGSTACSDARKVLSPTDDRANNAPSFPPLNRTALNATKGQERWGMRYAAAVLLTYWRHVGGEAVMEALRSGS